MTTRSSHPSIDMVTPAQTCAHLKLDEQAVLDLVNQGRLPAYNLGGSIRFKAVDVAAITALLTHS